MATSSITHNFVLDSETAVRFVEALEESEKNYVHLGTGDTHEIKDPKERRAFIKHLAEKYEPHAS